jgi:translocation and assembly module TamA
MVEAFPSEELNELGQRNVVVQLTPSSKRTIGGAVRYDTDLGPGVLGYWEHRNFTGRGDRLRFELPIWETRQEFAVNYRHPFFLRGDQDLIVSGGLLQEDTDFYRMFTGSGAIGLERRLTRYWTGTARVRGEGGWLEEIGRDERSYYMFGLPLSLTFNDTNSPLDATKGVRITASPGPYFGHYNDYFTALRARIDGNFFWSVLARDRLVLAFRASYGSLMMADAPEVPPSIRFYSGGGGSVRGYAYRSVGPRDDNNDPLGGNSLMEFSIESRWKFNDNWGVVFFVDSGMVYARNSPNFKEELLWGAGAGLRYYTVLGPIRFDVAAPLNPRNDDSSVHLYLSIGQSF